MTENNSTNKCCVWCRESLNDNFCNLPTCNCHNPAGKTSAPHPATDSPYTHVNGGAKFPPTPPGIDVLHAHPVTQSREWGERFDEIAANGQYTEYLYQRFCCGGDYCTGSKIHNDWIKDFIRQTLRTELESLLQEWPKTEDPREARNKSGDTEDYYEAQGFNRALSTMREVISKRIEEI